MKFVAATTAAILVIIMAYTWSELCISQDRFVELPQQFMDIGKFLVSGIVTGFVGFKLRG